MCVDTKVKEDYLLLYSAVETQALPSVTSTVASDKAAGSTDAVSGDETHQRQDILENVFSKNSGEHIEKMDEDISVLTDRPLLGDYEFSTFTTITEYLEDFLAQPSPVAAIGTAESAAAKDQMLTETALREKTSLEEALVSHLQKEKDIEGDFEVPTQTEMKVTEASEGSGEIQKVVSLTEIKVKAKEAEKFEGQDFDVSIVI